MSHTLAIVGYGGMGAYHHQQITTRVPGLKVKGVYDIRKERMDVAVAAGLYPYSSLEEILNDEEVDMVTVAVPNNFHKNISIKALESGKNVICEKPVTMDAAELEEILKVADRTGKLFCSHQNRRWDKDYRIIKEIVSSGVIGQPYYIESRVQGSKRVLAGWRGCKENGGGMVLDWGIHLVDQLMTLDTSTVIEVGAHLEKIYSKEVDDNCKLSLTFESGLFAEIEVSTNCFIPQARWHMSCEDGTAIISDWNCNGNIIKLSDDKDLGWTDDIIYTEAGPTRTMAPRPRETTEVLPLPQIKTDWSDFYLNYMDAMDGKAQLLVKHDEMLRVMKVIDAFFVSAEQGYSVKCRI